MQSIILKDSPKTKPTKNPTGIKSVLFPLSSGPSNFQSTYFKCTRVTLQVNLVLEWLGSGELLE